MKLKARGATDVEVIGILLVITIGLAVTLFSKPGQLRTPIGHTSKTPYTIRVELYEH